MEFAALVRFDLQRQASTNGDCSRWRPRSPEIRYFPNAWVQLDWGMPTVHRFDGLRVVIHPNDHRPAHVHVIGGGNEAIFALHCPHGPPELRLNYGFGYRHVNRISDTLAQALSTLCEHWRKIHGPH